MSITNRQDERMNSKMASCLFGAVAVASPTFPRADEAPPAAPAAAPATTSAAPTDYNQMYEEQKKRNDDLEKRISLLEDHSTQDLYVAKADLPENTVKF